VAAWANLAGIALSRIDLRVAAAPVLAVAILGAGDQQVIRSAGAHGWPDCPVSSGGSWIDYAGAASIIAAHLESGDGAVYPSATQGWLLTDAGVEYYLKQDLRPGAVLLCQLFAAAPSIQAHHLYPVICRPAAACLGQRARIWVVGFGHLTNPYAAVSPSEAAALRQSYAAAPELTRHIPGADRVPAGARLSPRPRYWPVAGNRWSGTARCCRARMSRSSRVTSSGYRSSIASRS